MKNIRPLLFFGGKFLLIYVLLIMVANTSFFQKTYREIYMIGAKAVSGVVHQNAVITCEKLDGGKTDDDIVFTFANKSSIEKAKEEARNSGQAQTNIKGFKWSFNIYRVDLMFLLFFLALVLAYPANWKRKAKGLFLGLLIYYLLSYLLLYGRMLLQMAKNKQVFPEYELGAFGDGLLTTATNMHTEGMFFIVLLLWGVLLIRTEDFNSVFHSA